MSNQFDKKQYLGVQMALVQMAATIENLNIEAFIEQADLALNAMPAVDPQIAALAGPNLRAIRNLAAEYLRVQKAIPAVKTSFEQSHARKKAAVQAEMVAKEAVAEPVPVDNVTPINNQSGAV